MNGALGAPLETDLDTHTGSALWISPHTDFRTTSTRKSVIRSYPHVLPHEPALARPIARGTLRLSWQVKKGEQESPTAHELVHFLEVQLSMGALPWLLSPGGQDMNPCILRTFSVSQIMQLLCPLEEVLCSKVASH